MGRERWRVADRSAGERPGGRVGAEAAEGGDEFVRRQRRPGEVEGGYRFCSGPKQIIVGSSALEAIEKQGRHRVEIDRPLIRALQQSRPPLGTGHDEPPACHAG